MFFWIIFSLSSVLICYFVSDFFQKKIKPLIFLISFVLMVTPATIEQTSNDLAPSLFIFFYDLLLEQSLSTRSLRPLALSIPIALVSFLILVRLKKRSSQILDH